MPRLNLSLVFGFLLGSFWPNVRPATAKDQPPSPEQIQFFESRIRPTLTDHCVKCHGADKQKAGLRVDSRGALLAGGDSGPAVVPGNTEESLLVTAINHGEDGPKMPPSKKLPAKQIDDLTQWVKMGAPWPGSDEAAPTSATRRGAFTISEKDRSHWAFQPVRSPAIPAVKDPSWVANPIDAFILSGLETKGLRPNPPAEKRQLIRRASYDLTGLPPTLDEVEAFLADNSPDAYTSMVDRLLDSPRYGEKWGRHWLDLVRFAETNSYERDNPKPNAWRYRDYVIRSFNDDKPYDRFVREQLAGDELPNPGADAVVATGFYRLGIWDDEPTDREQARYDGLDDIVATTGQVFLGLTVDCARCHDHKLDPIAQKDYYRLVSFFQNINHYRNGGPTDEMPIFRDDVARRSFEAEVEAFRKKRDALQAEISAIEDAFRLASQDSDGAPPQVDLDDLHYRFYRDTWETLPDFASLKPEDTGTLARPLFDLGPRTRNDAFGFVFDGVLIVPKDGRYTFHLDSDDGARLTVAGNVVVEYDGIHTLGAGGRQGEVELAKGRVPIRLEYFQNRGGFGLSVAWSGPDFAKRSLSAHDRKRGAAQAEFARAIKADGPRLLGAERAERYQQLRAELKALPREIKPGENALCVTEGGPKPPPTFVLLRGNPHVKGDQVEPAFLEVIGSPTPVIPTPPPTAKTSGRRLVLANWIASPENPLTARVMANRVWQYHFGRGIVRSPNNFGVQGDKPTHPDLLDWLASELVRGGWQLKPLHRMIMLSNAYRMSSRGEEAALAKDPINDSFWRFDMRRMGAEEIRDTILSVSGTLNLKMYGPGVYPEIPAEVMAGQSVPGSGWGKSPPEEQARRSVYVHVKRSLLTPILEGFDIAETDRSTPVRFATTQPTQALAMLNGSFLNQQAETLARRVRREAGHSLASRVDRALRLATTRPPTDAEVARGVALVESLKANEGASDDSALQTFCLMVLNLNEMIYVD